MPNRILKESICTSDNIDQLSPFAEIAFYRLMVNCDDYGRMDARTKILKSRLFPLKDASESDIKSWLKELSEADLITLYEVDGRPYLQMKTWEKHQQVRAKRSKYPSPDVNMCEHLQADNSTCNQLIADDSKSSRNPIQSESESESESISESISESSSNHLRVVKPLKRFIPPTVDEVQAYCDQRSSWLIDPQAFIDYYEARGWMLNKNRKMVDWKAAVRTWEHNERERQEKERHQYEDLPY